MAKARAAAQWRRCCSPSMPQFLWASALPQTPARGPQNMEPVGTSAHFRC